MNMDIAQYARVVCALLDIPVYDKLTESLHLLFSLYRLQVQPALLAQLSLLRSRAPRLPLLYCNAALLV